MSRDGSDKSSLSTRPPPEPEELTDVEVRARLRTLSRRGFAGAGAAAVGALLAGRWVQRWAAQEDGLAWPLRRALQANEAVSRRLFSPAHLAPSFPRAAVGDLRANGMAGLEDENFEPGEWRLELEGLAAGSTSLDLSALQAMPRTEMITEFKCIEGWSTVAQWAGVSLAALARTHPPATRSGRPFDPSQPEDAPPYVSLATPDGEYFVGLETASALHPQTLLAWELNGAPLTSEHGAPLRLVVPVKYGIKCIKRIGTLAWRAERPADYWAARGYDWYAGL
jgi:DMSO/TMAO reductase YedYZ molybdopterin-dependent catalytic subunit